MNLSILEFLLQQSWQAIRRNGLVSLATSTNMTVALTILGAFFLTTMNLEHMADVEARKVIITVDLLDDADAGEVEAKLLGDERVAHTKFVPKEQAMEETWAKSGHEAGAAVMQELEAEGLVKNPLPNGIRISVENPQDIPAVAASARGIDGVKKVRYRKQITDKLLTLAHGMKVSGIVLAVVMGVATLLLVSTTIRLTIYARRREIRIMQLVGATSWFIRLPFMLEGGFHGVIGGVLASIFLLASYGYVQSYVGENLAFIELIFGTQSMALFGLGTVFCGIIFGVAGSWLGLRSYLRAV